MQANDVLEPIVRIRDLKKDSVNFVLENVDLAYVVLSGMSFVLPSIPPRFANSLRRVMMADIPTVGELVATVFLSS
jgi:DNA-directed RNA polymerase II subunit RPB3